MKSTMPFTIIQNIPYIGIHLSGKYMNLEGKGKCKTIYLEKETGKG